MTSVKAVREAETHEFYDVEFRVLTPPYLIALLAGRLKDYTKIDKLIDEGPELDVTILEDLLTRFGLWKKWRYYLTVSETETPPEFVALQERKARYRALEAARPFEEKMETLRRLRERADYFVSKRAERRER